MPSDLDRRFDAMLARVTGPGGRLVIERDRRQSKIGPGDCVGSGIGVLQGLPP